MADRKKLFLMPKARSDLEEILDYISNSLLNPNAAKDLLNDFDDAFERICVFPQSCPVIHNEFFKYKGIRKLLVNNYIVFYRIVDEIIQIIRIMYARKNYIRLLKEQD